MIATDRVERDRGILLAGVMRRRKISVRRRMIAFSVMCLHPVSGSVMGTLKASSSVITTVLQSRWDYCHFTDEKTEVPGG